LDEERAIIETHPQRGYEELCGREDMTHEQLMMVYQHHERFDGKGYPVGFQGVCERVDHDGAGDAPVGGDGDGDENDELFQDAVKLVLEFGKASTSLLQRRLRIGYGRAAHLIDLMERDGIVGPADGPKPREILKRPDWLSEVEEALR